MKEAIKKILKSYVFRDSKLPKFKINIYVTPDPDRKLYEVEVVLNKEDESFHSEERAEKIREKMKTGLEMLGLTNVNGRSIFYSDKEVSITASGNLRTNR